MAAQKTECRLIFRGACAKRSMAVHAWPEGLDNAWKYVSRLLFHFLYRRFDDGFNGNLASGNLVSVQDQISNMYKNLLTDCNGKQGDDEENCRAKAREDLRNNLNSCDLLHRITISKNQL
jgi:hypothetical protein